MPEMRGDKKAIARVQNNFAHVELRLIYSTRHVLTLFQNLVVLERKLLDQLAKI